MYPRSASREKTHFQCIQCSIQCIIQCSIQCSIRPPPLAFHTMTFHTIDDFYVSDDDLKQSPSAKDGVSEEVERRLRRYGCSLIWQVCHRLDLSDASEASEASDVPDASSPDPSSPLPMSVYATASSLLQRFYCKSSLAEYDVRIMAPALFWMSCKLEEAIVCDDSSRLRLRDVLVLFYDCICRGPGAIDRTDGADRTDGTDGSVYMLNVYSTFYASFKEAVIKAERDMLRCFGFVMHVEHAAPFVLTLGAQLGFASRKDILQTAYNIASDSLRTTLCVRVKAECVACAALFLAAERHGWVLPEDWWEGCGVEWNSMETCCRAIVEMYAEVDAEHDGGNNTTTNDGGDDGSATRAERFGVYVRLSTSFLTFDASNGADAIVIGPQELE